MGFRIVRFRPDGGPQLLFRFWRHALQAQNAGEGNARVRKCGAQADRGSEMGDGGIQFSLLRQNPAKGSLRGGIGWCSADYIFERSPGGGKIILAESVQPALVGCGRWGHGPGGPC